MALGKKTGGRARGTPNLATTLGREALAKFLDEYLSSGMMSEDFKAVSPKDRLMLVERLLQYRLPKYQSAAFDIKESGTGSVLLERLRSLCGDNGDGK